MIIGAGIDASIFGTGLSGDYTVTSGTNIIENGGDKYAKTISWAKVSGGDPDFTVWGTGQRYFATRKILIGSGVTLFGKHHGSPGPDQSVGFVGTTIGGNTGNGGTGAGGANNGSPGLGGAGMGGNGGAGGAANPHTGGAGGVINNSPLKAANVSLQAFLTGHALLAGSQVAILGGASGGGGGSEAGGAGGDGGAGAGAIIMAAPIIQIDGIVDMRGWAGGNAPGGGISGGGGGGGGGLLILICGQLILNGTINMNGGDGGAGFGGVDGHGGVGGAGGQYFVFSGDWENLVRVIGSTGATGASG
jgi:hypothetical protein